MTKNFFTGVSFLVIYLSFFVAGSAQTAKNVIILIGDGNGFNSDLAGTYYRYGEAGKERYHSFPVAIGCTTYSRTDKNVELPADVLGYDPKVFWETIANGTQSSELTKTTDSAASSTAIHGGTKTSNGRIGMTYDKKTIELISEIAVKHGKKAGTVTTVPMSHATPAGFSAHSESRNDLGAIFTQMVSQKSHLSVIMGCGHPFYEQGKQIKIKDNENEKEKSKRFDCVGGEKNWEQMKSGTLNGFKVIETIQQFEELASGKGVVPDKIIGVVRSLSPLPPVDGSVAIIPPTTGESGQISSSSRPLTTPNENELKQSRELLDKSYENTDWNELPSLSTMSLAALNVLTKNNPNGFVLMIEGGAIDLANHGRDIGKSVLEHVGFSKAIDTVIDWVEKNSSWDETLVIVTADHETGQIWGPETYNDNNKNRVFDKGDSFNEFKKVQNNGRGNVPNVQYGSNNHTNALVPLYAKGAGANLFLKQVKGTDQKAAQFWNFNGQYVDDTDIFKVIKTVISP
ncbi:MAG: alkaline phosphatase [Planctomycetaceae bacterium]|jgi:alkaline phosphatase|nr:alkaline phosphatase [Planctomycetaceae bacterium]